MTVRHLANYYEDLQISRSASADVIRSSYHTLVQKYHPDRHSPKDEAEQITEILNEAFAVLNDPVRRQAYDIRMEFAPPPQQPANGPSKPKSAPANPGPTGAWKRIFVWAAIGAVLSLFLAHPPLAHHDPIDRIAYRAIGMLFCAIVAGLCAAIFGLFRRRSPGEGTSLGAGNWLLIAVLVLLVFPLLGMAIKSYNEQQLQSAAGTMAAAPTPVPTRSIDPVTLKPYNGDYTPLPVTQTPEQAMTKDWNTVASQWEAQHADFLSNPKRHADMQRALQLEAARAREKGETPTYLQLLDRAGATAMAYSGYTSATATTATATAAEAASAAANSSLESANDPGAFRPLNRACLDRYQDNIASVPQSASIGEAGELFSRYRAEAVMCDRHAR